MKLIRMYQILQLELVASAFVAVIGKVFNFLLLEVVALGTVAAGYISYIFLSIFDTRRKPKQ